MNKDRLGNDINEGDTREGMLNMNINDLPQEMLVEIFSNLELVQLNSLRLVCKYWNVTVSDNSIWEKSFRAKFSNDDVFPSFASTSSWIVEYLSRIQTLKRWKKAVALHMNYQMLNEVYVGDNEYNLTNFRADRFLAYSRINNNITICSLRNGRNQTFIPGNYYSIKSFAVNWSYLVFGTNDGGLYHKNLMTSTSSSSSRSSLKELISNEYHPGNEVISHIQLNLDFDRHRDRLDIVTGSSTGVIRGFNLNGSLLNIIELNDQVIKIECDFKKHIVVVCPSKIIIINFSDFQVRQINLEFLIEDNFLINFDLPDNNVIIGFDNKIRIINYTHPSNEFIKKLDLNEDIKFGKIQGHNKKINRNVGLIGKDGLFHALVLKDESIVIINVREEEETLTFRRFQTEFKYKNLSSLIQNENQVNSIELNSSVIIVGGFNGYANVHDIFTGKFLRECSIKYPKRYLHMFQYKIPVREIKLNENCQITNGVIICGDVVQYFQFGEDIDTNNNKNNDSKKKLNVTSNDKKYNKKVIKSQLEDYDIEEYNKFKTDSMFDKYNGNDNTSEDELTLAIALSESTTTGPEHNNYNSSNDTTKNSDEDEDEDEQLKKALEISKNQDDTNSLSISAGTDRTDNITTTTNNNNNNNNNDDDDQELTRALELSQMSQMSEEPNEDEQLKKILELSLIEK